MMNKWKEVNTWTHLLDWYLTTLHAFILKDTPNGPRNYGSTSCLHIHANFNVATQGLVFHVGKVTKAWIQRTIALLNLPWKSSFFYQNTMTDSTILLEDVQKMKDKGEIAQAYIGLKETNRYKFSFFNLWSVGVTWGLMWHTAYITFSKFHPSKSSYLENTYSWGYNLIWLV